MNTIVQRLGLGGFDMNASRIVARASLFSAVLGLALVAGSARAQAVYIPFVIHPYSANRAARYSAA